MAHHWKAIPAAATHREHREMQVVAEQMAVRVEIRTIQAAAEEETEGLEAREVILGHRIMPMAEKPGAVFSQVSPALTVMGGGGGAGTTNNSTGTPSAGFASSGSAGGGIVIITTTSVTTTGTGTINVSGTAANNTVINDGSGGGGAGGSVLFFSQATLSNIIVTATGGTGGTNTPGGATYHGPGGGGGGGVVYSNYSLNALSSVSGGASGTSITTGGTSSYGASAGSTGIINQSIAQSQLPPATPSCNYLPVILGNFSASLIGNAVYLHWQVENQINFSLFDIEFSSDGINFADIGKIDYENDQSAYSFEDEQPKQGNNFYRLKMVDLNGKYTYSNVLLVTISFSNNQVSVYPNPAADFVTLQYSAINNQQLMVEIFDYSGRKFLSKNFTSVKGQNYFTIPEIKSLSTSIYIIKITNGTSIYTYKLSVIK